MARKPKAAPTEQEPAAVTETPTTEPTTEPTAPEAPPTVETKPEGPVAICRRILTELRAASPEGVVSRADAVAAFVAAGINVATARTQYQRLYKQ